MPGSAATLPAAAPGVDAVREVDGGEGAEGAVVNDVGIGDGQDNARPSCPQPAVEDVLEIDDLRLPDAVGLGVHAVVRSDGDGGAERGQSREVAVHHPVERVGGRSAGACLCWT